MRQGSKIFWTGLLFIPFLCFATYQINAYHHRRSIYRAAQEALERRDFREAQIYLQKCQTVWPRDPTAWLLAAQTARRWGDFVDARRQLRTYAEMKGPPAALELENRLLRLQEGDLTEADMLMSFSINNPDGLDTPYILEALIQGSLRKLGMASLVLPTLERREAARPGLERARKAVDLWLRLLPGRADQIQGLVWSGVIHNLADEYPKDVADYRRALALEPRHYEARLYLAQTLSPYDPAAACGEFEKLRKWYPEKNLVLISLAELRRSLGQLDEARELLDQMLADNPDDVAALIERGNVALDTQHVKNAERFLRRAVALAPQNPKTHLTLSRCLQLTGRLEEAKESRERAAALEAAQQRRERELAERLRNERRRNTPPAAPKGTFPAER